MAVLITDEHEVAAGGNAQIISNALEVVAECLAVNPDFIGAIGGANGGIAIAALGYSAELLNVITLKKNAIDGLGAEVEHSKNGCNVTIKGGGSVGQDHKSMTFYVRSDGSGDRLSIDHSRPSGLTGCRTAVIYCDGAEQVISVNPNTLDLAEWHSVTPMEWKRWREQQCQKQRAADETGGVK